MKLHVAVVAFAVFAFGCRSVPFITKDGAAPAVATPGQATVVVAQSFTYPQVNLVDGQGKVVGQIGPRQYTVIPWQPGEIKLAAFPGHDPGRGDRVVGTVEAGKVYYFVVGFRMRGLTIQTVTPRNDKEEWNNRKTYVRDLTAVSMDPSRVNELEKALGEERARAFAEIDDDVKGWTDEEKKNRRVEPSDGDPG